jgi:hypothetical protein
LLRLRERTGIAVFGVKLGGMLALPLEVGFDDCSLPVGGMLALGFDDCVLPVGGILALPLVGGILALPLGGILALPVGGILALPLVVG